jgi:hypothetical protein
MIINNSRAPELDGLVNEAVGYEIKRDETFQGALFWV